MSGLEELKNFEMGVLRNGREGVKSGSLRAAHTRIPFSDEYPPGPESRNLRGTVLKNINH